MNKKNKMAAVILGIILCLAAAGPAAGESVETTGESEAAGPAAAGPAAAEYGPGVNPDVYRADQEAMYTYEDMEHDLSFLQSRYRDIVTVDSLGETLDGRSLDHMVIGRPEAANHVLVFASIHAREYITTQVLMGLTRDFLAAWSDGSGAYKGAGYGQLMENTAVHIVPMVNPDGVAISQFGLDGAKKPETRERLAAIAAMDGAGDMTSYFIQWKANAEGVDLNRNFDALWDQYQGAGHPSSGFYKGEYPASAAEAAALVDLTNRYAWKRTISYHAQGNVVYWYFRQDGDLLAQSRRFADEISQVTGYPLDGNYNNLDPAGYKDWAILQKQIPSLTIEVGTGGVPVAEGQLAGICERNKDVLAATLYTLMPGTGV